MNRIGFKTTGRKKEDAAVELYQAPAGAAQGATSSGDVKMALKMEILQQVITWLDAPYVSEESLNMTELKLLRKMYRR